MLHVVLLATILTAPSKIDISLEYGGIGCCQREAYTINVSGNSASRDGAAIDMRAVRELLSAINEPQLDAPDAENLHLTTK